MSTALSTRREDYYRFHEVQVECRDMDPAYPVLNEVGRALDMNTEGRLWLLLLFTSHYHMGSTMAALLRATDPRAAVRASMDLPCATERRGHWYRPRLEKHLKAISEIASEAPNGLTRWFLSDLNGTPEENWAQVQHRASLLPGNGRWASFKTTELIQQLIGPDIAAPDMQHAHSSGPRKGLGLLYANLPTDNDPASIALLDGFSRQLVQDMARHGLKVSVETAETSLCDFHALVDGRYYPGHDIDQMQLQLEAVPSELAHFAWRARRKTLPLHYLGEVTGRSGIDRQAMICYRTTGRIPVRDTKGGLR